MPLESWSWQLAHIIPFWGFSHHCFLCVRASGPKSSCSRVLCLYHHWIPVNIYGTLWGNCFNFGTNVNLNSGWTVLVAKGQRSQSPHAHPVLVVNAIVSWKKNSDFLDFHWLDFHFCQLRRQDHDDAAWFNVLLFPSWWSCYNWHHCSSCSWFRWENRCVYIFISFELSCSDIWAVPSKLCETRPGEAESSRLQQWTSSVESTWKEKGAKCENWSRVVYVKLMNRITCLCVCV